jgi:hypothetical protein
MFEVVTGANDPIARPCELKAKKNFLHDRLSDNPATFTGQSQRKAILKIFAVDGIENVQYDFSGEGGERKRPKDGNWFGIMKIEQEPTWSHQTWAWLWRIGLRDGEGGRIYGGARHLTDIRSICLGDVRSARACRCSVASNTDPWLLVALFVRRLSLG